eukprot:231382_1
MAAYDKMSLCVPEDGEDHIRHSISSPNLKFQKEVRFLEHSPISEGWDISSSRLTPPSRSTVQDMSRVLARISRSFEDSSVLRTVHTNIPSPVLSAKKHNRHPYDEKRSASPTVIPHLVPGVSSLRESSLRDVRISLSPSSKMDNYLKPRSLDSPSHTEAARESSDVEIICGSHEDEYRGMSGSMNPFRHHTHQEKPKEGRWNHLFPTGQEYSSITGRTMLDIRDCHEPEYWTTMIEPAVLPLSTDYAPAKSQMQRHIYQISLDPMRQDFEDSSGLFVEMMTQRLCHGFQLVLSDSKGFLANRQPSPLSVAPLSPGQSYELYLNKQLHNLQLFENGNIEVSRSFAPYDANPLRLPYSYFVWDRFENDFVSTETILCARDEDVDVDWNTFDQIVAGLTEECGQVPSKCIRFSIVPEPTLASAKPADNVEAIPSRWSAFCQWFESVTSQSPAKTNISFEKTSVSHTHGLEPIRMSVALPGQWSKRFECLTLYFDRVFRADSCFHVEIHWIVASGRVVNDWVQTAIRKAKNLNLNMVQFPVQTKLSSASSNPFTAHTILPIRFPSMLSHINAALLTRFGFVYDTCMSSGIHTQPGTPHGIHAQWPLRVGRTRIKVKAIHGFTHHTGCVMVVVKTKKLIFIENPLSHTSPDESLIIFIELKRFVHGLEATCCTLTNL